MTAIEDAVKEFSMAIPVGVQTLDVGCGLRPYEKYFFNGIYVGIDVPKSGREDSGKKPNFEFDGINIPFEDAYFDAVICTEVLEHALEPDSLLQEMYRVLKPEGQILITVPFMWGLHELPYDFRRYTIVGIKRAVETAGFSITTQKKLTEGIDAVQMLIASEINQYLVHRIGESTKNSYKFKVSYFLQAKLLRLLFFIWKRTFRFERIYIDNMIVAKKAATADLQSRNHG